jgi:hypothetical protein
MDLAARQALASTATRFSIGVEFSLLWLYCPWSPHRRRHWGFGLPSSAHIATHKEATYHIVIHFAWTYLAPRDSHCATQVLPTWCFYHRLRLRAVTTSLAPLHFPRASPGQPVQLPEHRFILYACALLRFHFYYGDLVRWLGGEYTNRHCDWSTTFQTLKQVCTRRLLQLIYRPLTFRAAFTSVPRGYPSPGSLTARLSLSKLVTGTIIIPPLLPTLPMLLPSSLRRKRC